jgi:hypothetical protein
VHAVGIWIHRFAVPAPVLPADLNTSDRDLGLNGVLMLPFRGGRMLGVSLRDLVRHEIRHVRGAFQVHLARVFKCRVLPEERDGNYDESERPTHHNGQGIQFQIHFMRLNVVSAKKVAVQKTDCPGPFQRPQLKPSIFGPFLDDNG